MASHFQPLSGLRVIDLTQVLAGPYATYQLALMGAEVIKIEHPEGGDWTRAGQGLPGHENAALGASFLTQNANKQSVAVNLKHPEGIALVKQLIADADIFVENFSPGAAARLGLSFDDVRALNDRILYASISAYGQDGPFSHRPAYDHVVQGMCGIMTTTGTAETAPNKVGSPYVDYATGMNAALAIVSGVLQQQRNGGDALHLDVAMLDSAMLLMSSMLTQTLSLGVKHRANGNEAFSRSPSSGAFQTTDGVLMIAANNDRQFERLCHALGREDILSDPRWADKPSRAQHQDALRSALAQTIAGNSATHWETVLDEARVPAARVRSIEQILAEDQLRERELMVEMPIDGAHKPAHMPSLGFKANGQATKPTAPPPRLGADTQSVLAAMGLSNAKISELSQAGAIGPPGQS